MDHGSIKRIDFVFHLEKAIENGEFEVYYQPIIHTISGSLCGFEALVRWHHPKLGFLTPMQFLPSLEETKQMYSTFSSFFLLVFRSFYKKSDR